MLHTTISFEKDIKYIYALSKTKVKFGGLEIPFRKNSFGKKTNY